MRYKIIALLLATFCLSAWAAKGLPTPRSSVQPIDQIVAVVNSDIITQSEINATYRRALKQIKKRHGTVPDESTLKNEILNQLIYKKLQLQLAKRYGFKVTNSQVDVTVKSIAKQHRMTIDQLKQKIKSDGLNYAQYRKEIKNQIMISLVQRQALGTDIKVSNAEADQFLKKYKGEGKFATHYHQIDLRIPLPAASTSAQSKQAKAEAIKILGQLKQGADIYKVAGVLVTDLGWRTTASLPNLFTHQLSTMKTGSIVGPLRAENGYHLIKLVGIRRSKTSLPTRKQVKHMLLQRKFEKALGAWLMKLRKKAYVKILAPQ